MLSSTPEIDAKLNQTVTYPVYLIETDYGPQKYLSTGPTITTMGQDWISGTTDVDGMSDGQSINIVFDNSDFSLTQSAQLAEWRGKSINVWLVIIKEAQYFPYGIYSPGIYESGVYETEISVPLEVVGSIKLFSGEFDRAGGVTTDKLKLTALRAGINTNITPRQRINAPTFNHLPAPGTVIQLGNETIIIE